MNVKQMLTIAMMTPPVQIPKAALPVHVMLDMKEMGKRVPVRL